MTPTTPMDDRLAVGFCLDESSSMRSVASGTITGFNEYIKGLSEQPGETVVTVTKFSSHVGERHRALCENLAVANVPTLTTANYTPNGNTPLFDAIGYTIKKMESWLSAQTETWPVFFVIQTDGEENSSVEFTRQQIFDLIQKKEAEGWKFIYLGADQDEFDAARIGTSMGMSAGSTYSYASANTSGTVSGLSTTASALRADPTLDSAQLRDITKVAAEQKDDTAEKDTSTPNF